MYKNSATQIFNIYIFASYVIFSVGTNPTKLGAALDLRNAHPDITLLILLAVETDEVMHAGIGRNSDVAFTPILEAQSKIGWDLVKYGFLSMEWKATQHDGVSHRDPNHNSNQSKRWMKIVQESLWKYVANIWEHRNNVIHRKNKGRE